MTSAMVPTVWSTLSVEEALRPETQTRAIVAVRNAAQLMDPTEFARRGPTADYTQDINSPFLVRDIENVMRTNQQDAEVQTFSCIAAVACLRGSTTAEQKKRVEVSGLVTMLVSTLHAHAQVAAIQGAALTAIHLMVREELVTRVSERGVLRNVATALLEQRVPASLLITALQIFQIIRIQNSNVERETRDLALDAVVAVMQSSSTDIELLTVALGILSDCAAKDSHRRRLIANGTITATVTTMRVCHDVSIQLAALEVLSGISVDARGRQHMYMHVGALLTCVREYQVDWRIPRDVYRVLEDISGDYPDEIIGAEGAMATIIQSIHAHDFMMDVTIEAVGLLSNLANTSSRELRAHMRDCDAVVVSIEALLRHPETMHAELLETRTVITRLHDLE